MTESGFKTLERMIIQRLKKGLDKRLTYHNLEHTLDVLKQAERIANEEGIVDQEQLLHIKIAALYHDTGFLDTYKGHEKRSCEIMLEDLQDGKFSKDELDTICGMIMATRIPQKPNGILEEIICDADLDYLGREDFPPISQSLMKEFLEYGIIIKAAEWDPIQIDFFEKHQYFTKSSRSIRQPGKLEHLKLLKEKQSILNLTKNKDG
ncbi:HD domain-containing protein [Flavihumibacter sp. UBA7668]|uniref:HD domain-containing protein n=1 Tax=Flavihumibacter sp. UBA7668 TaxID=1946542 RepID=UPI0025C57ECF|nr:HD domain-containing protein [Flavihumibacter sp. UBA7668]